MQIRFFTIPVTMVDDFNEELNAFLRTVKVVEIEKQLVEASNGVYWCICVSYLAAGYTGNFSKEKIDYRKVLTPEVFERFSKLREIRKKIAADDGVSAYVVFTDADLAEIAKLPEISIGGLKRIKGVGDKKAEKYGDNIIKMMLLNTNNEKGGPTHSPDSLF